MYECHAKLQCTDGTVQRVVLEVIQIGVGVVGVADAPLNVSALHRGSERQAASAATSIAVISFVQS